MSSRNPRPNWENERNRPSRGEPSSLLTVVVRGLWQVMMLLGELVMGLLRLLVGRSLGTGQGSGLTGLIVLIIVVVVLWDLLGMTFGKR